MRDTGGDPQRRHLRVECIGLGARAVQIERAGLAFAQATFHARSGLVLRGRQALHDAQTLRRTAQHEVLSAHFACHRQARRVGTGDGGRGIGLRGIPRRAEATGSIDLPGNVETGAQRARVGQA